MAKTFIASKSWLRRLAGTLGDIIVKMRKVKILILLILSSNLFGQEIEDKICFCLTENFNLAGLDYYKIIEEVELDLMKNNIIDKTSKSRLDQFVKVAEIGVITKPRTYENIKFEQLGLNTLKHCVSLITYTSNCEPPPSFSLFREMDYLKQEIQQEPNFNLSALRTKTAQIIIENNGKFNQDSKLWKIIQLSYLYWLSEINDLGVLIDLPAYDFSNQDTSNTVKIHVSPDDKITFEGIFLEKHEICQYLKPKIIQKKGVYFTNERNTKYKLYLDVYNELKDCFLTLRNEKAIELYQNKYDELNNEQTEIINEMIPLRIIENEPK
ncbi:MAG: hypothetical protein IPN89_11535 [Saprospiraceae bacterium]|nr:hypothetical protein [Saprospiraceae bacterium]